MELEVAILERRKSKILVQKKPSCGGCQMAEGCTAGRAVQIIPLTPSQLDFEKMGFAEEGDEGTQFSDQRAIVSTPGGSLLKAAFLSYGVPTLSLLLVIISSKALWPSMEGWLQVVVSGAGVIFGYFCMQWLSAFSAISPVSVIISQPDAFSRKQSPN